MLKKIISLSLLSTLSLITSADDLSEINRSQVETYLDIRVNVPTLCNITNGSITSINFGNFIKETITKNLTYMLECNQGTNVKFSIGLGSNPNSTAQARRMPLNGELGDVPNYLIYQIKNLDDDQLVGINEFAINRYVQTTSSTYRYIRLSFIVPPEQPNIVVGQYKERLDVEIEYF